jgi:guanine deaminase
MNATGAFAVVGTVIDAPVIGELRIRDKALVVVDASGAVSAVRGPTDADYHTRCDVLRRSGQLVELGKGQYLLPGLIDLHIHAPQWPHMGKALDVSLAEWLMDYTFPLEAKYQDIGFAEDVYASLVDAMVANGTTTAVYFATRHVPATQRLAEICVERGQRALVGKVAMDAAETCPDFYRDDSAGQAIDETRQLIDQIRGIPGNEAGRVLPVITPRFVPSCTDELLRGLGELAAETGCHVQTHCSESDWAHSYGIERFGHSDTMTYADMGLLRRSTVLAHSNFVSSRDMDAIAAAGAAVAHCPLSNAYFANAVFPLREALDRGVHVGLGTDISGGPGPSIFTAARNAVAVSRIREDGTDATVAADRRGIPGVRVSTAEAFWLATTGGGAALDLPIGVISPGYSFDAQVVDTDVPDSDLMVWPEFDSGHDVLEKMIHNAGRRNVAMVWVQGNAVKGPSA